MPKLVLLDGHSLAYRAFYALPSDLATSQGQVTNAAYGFTSMLIKLLGDEHPDGLAVAWDLKGGTFRNERYPEYKAQREAPPDIFRTQLPLIERVATVMNIPQFAHRRGSKPTTSSPPWPSEPSRRAGRRWSSPAIATPSSSSSRAFR